MDPKKLLVVEWRFFEVKAVESSSLNLFSHVIIIQVEEAVLKSWSRGSVNTKESIS